mgnify:CR=1 FL=1
MKASKGLSFVEIASLLLCAIPLVGTTYPFLSALTGASIRSPVEIAPSHSDNATLWLYVRVHDIKSDQKMAMISIGFVIDGYRGRGYPVITVRLYDNVWGGEIRRVNCSELVWPVYRPEDPRRYYGTLEKVLCPIAGLGEYFPFDAYNVTFLLWQPTYTSLDNQTGWLDLVVKEEWCDWILERELDPTWTPSAGPLSVEDYWGMIFPDFCLVTFKINRKPILPFFQFLLPVMLCYFFLGGSHLISANNLDTRLRVYMSLFVFSPGFLLAIQNYMPRRFTFTIPEFLLTSLVVFTSVYGFVSMLIYSMVKKGFWKPESGWPDFCEGIVGIGLSVWLVYYCSTFLREAGSWVFVILSFPILIAIAIPVHHLVRATLRVRVPTRRRSINHETNPYHTE